MLALGTARKAIYGRCQAKALGCCSARIAFCILPHFHLLSSSYLLLPSTPHIASISFSSPVSGSSMNRLDEGALPFALAIILFFFIFSFLIASLHLEQPLLLCLFFSFMFAGIKFASWIPFICLLTV
ncbi:uncharacterized protein BDV17DRAFT_78803 [Aspergillus undulatus]|uniref:uncharacterized protein n=1 Tax=Aspergillus undulatus TaxID=1810928 RepID=UPI003CCD5A70